MYWHRNRSGRESLVTGFGNGLQILGKDISIPTHRQLIELLNRLARRTPHLITADVMRYLRDCGIEPSVMASPPKMKRYQSSTTTRSRSSSQLTPDPNYASYVGILPPDAPASPSRIIRGVKSKSQDSLHRSNKTGNVVGGRLWKGNRSNDELSSPSSGRRHAMLQSRRRATFAEHESGESVYGSEADTPDRALHSRSLPTTPLPFLLPHEIDSTRKSLAPADAELNTRYSEGLSRADLEAMPS